MGLKCIHEAAHSLYIKHVYNEAVADTFFGDDLLGAGRTIQAVERVNNVAKRVQKLTAAYKAAIGQSGFGGNTSGRRGGVQRFGSCNSYSGGKQQEYNI